MVVSPGDYLQPDEDEVEGLKRRLDERLAPANVAPAVAQKNPDNDWEIGDCLAQWWRPNFETFMVSSTEREVLGISLPQNLWDSGVIHALLSSTRISLPILRSRKSVRSCSWSKCLSEVRPLLISTPKNHLLLTKPITYAQRSWQYLRI